MKLTYKQVDGFLRAPDGEYRACLVYGPDSGLVRERASLVRRRILGDNADGFAFAEIDIARLLDDSALLADELRTVHMLAPKRIVLIRGATDKLTAVIESAAEFLHPSCYLLVIADELGTRSSLRAWFEKTPNVAALACYHDEARDIRELIRQSLSAASVHISQEGLDYLAAQLGNDRFVTRQELEKISLYAGDGGSLALEDVRLLVDNNREGELDTVALAAAGRDLAALEQALQLQRREHASPVSYIRVLQRYFNRLYKVRLEMDSGRDAESVVKSLKPPVFYKQVPLVIRHAQSWNIDQIVRALALLMEAELSCKSSDLPAFAASSRKLFQVTQLR